MYFFLAKQLKTKMTKKITLKKDQRREIILEQPGDYLVELAGPGAEADIRGSFQAADKDNLNISVVIHHKSPHTSAKTMLRGVAADHARIKFTGRIIIDPGCEDSNSFLTERVLLLSEHSKAECIPDLEIYTDDVRCSHAASVSKIPEEHVFYLMSRGIERSKAEKLIVEGFLHLED